MTTNEISRRALLGAGAAGAGAAALGALSLDAALAQDGGGTLGSSKAAEAPSALPPLIPGARQCVMHFSDIHPMGNTATRIYSNGGVYETTGWLDLPIPLDPGCRVVRVDVYGVRETSGSVLVGLGRTQVDTTANVDITQITTNVGVGVVTGSYVPGIPITIGNGQRLYLEGGGDANNKLAGAIVQYFDANPQLNILPAPVRVYDSRAGSPPLGVTKGQLADGGTRTVDCKLAGAVPAGAAAALVTLTVTNTSPAGFLALYKNGIVWPGTSSINWDHSGTSIAATAVVALDSLAVMQAYVSSGSSTDFLVDVAGFYA